MTALDEPLSIRQLEVFVALVEEGSFTAAARRLGLSQSTVSGHVADLERRLGTRVVARGGRRARPTAAGQALLAPARETLQAERATRMAVEELRGLLRGRLAVGGSTIPATYLLPAVFARFHALHAGIELRLVTGDSQDVLDRVLGADLELGVVGREPDHPDLEATQVGEDRLVLVLPASHAFAGRRSLTASEVAALPLVLREEGSGTRAATLSMLDAAGAPASALNVVAEVGSTEAVKGAVRAGLGAAFVSSLAVAEEVESGALGTVAVEGGDVSRAFHLVTRKGAYLGPAARAFCDVIRGEG